MIVCGSPINCMITRVVLQESGSTSKKRVPSNSHPDMIRGSRHSVSTSSSAVLFVTKYTKSRINVYIQYGLGLGLTALVHPPQSNTSAMGRSCRPAPILYTSRSSTRLSFVRTFMVHGVWGGGYHSVVDDRQKW